MTTKFIRRQLVVDMLRTDCAKGSSAILLGVPVSRTRDNLYSVKGGGPVPLEAAVEQLLAKSGYTTRRGGV
jgi:hypothetical protein